MVPSQIRPEYICRVLKECQSEEVEDVCHCMDDMVPPPGTTSIWPWWKKAVIACDGFKDRSKLITTSCEGWYVKRCSIEDHTVSNVKSSICENNISWKKMFQVSWILDNVYLSDILPPQPLEILWSNTDHDKYTLQCYNVYIVTKYMI